ncbi:YihY/virulence factor BrkB family protein [Desulfopila sp. IMCC35008]|uniref:YihY/virulence factor BrkB family protein n=1 Tax=Desulfopila sp. IMCC35008 TaxID=2653858 RepID=UPI0013D84109|nr:YihY/virulence factor BrkB family protein [Desulfopila sp. IMCC35008]
MPSTSSQSQKASKFLHWVDDRSPVDPLRESVRRLIRLILITFGEFRKNDLPLRAGALTYTVLLSLVPVLAMSTAVVKGLGGGDELREVAYTYLETLEQSSSSPPEQQILTDQELTSGEEGNTEQGETSLTGHLRSGLDTLFNYVDNTNFTALGSFGIAGILVSVILVFGTIETAMNRIWHVADGRSIIRKISDYLTIMVLMPISINVAFAASAFLKNRTLSDKFDMLIPFAWVQALILKLVPIFFIALTFYVIYIFFPNTKVRNRPAILGATLAAILWFIVQNVYITMQIGVANYNAIYGSFATLPLFLVWMYLAWLFVLTGAQVAYAIQNLSGYRLLPYSPIPSLRLSAAFDILEEVRCGFADNVAVTRQDLAQKLYSYDAMIVDTTISELCEAGFLCTAKESDRLLPAGPANDAEQKKIINLILGTQTPQTEGGEIGRKVLEAASQEKETTKERVESKK